MDVWFCVRQGPSPRGTNRELRILQCCLLTRSSVARVGRILFSLDRDLSWKSANRPSAASVYCPTRRRFARFAQSNAQYLNGLWRAAGSVLDSQESITAIRRGPFQFSEGLSACWTFR